MSMSSSAAARAPVKSAAGQASHPEPQAPAEHAPFPYAEAGPHGAGHAGAGQDAGEKMRQMQAESFEQGRKAAEGALRAEAQAAVEEHRRQLQSAIEDFARERERYYQRVEPELVQLALAIARKILHR